MTFATRDSFLKTSQERRFKETALWNGDKVLIRSLTEKEYSLIDVENIDANKGGFSRDGMRLSDVRLLVASVCDANPDSPSYKQPLFGQPDLAALFNVDTIAIRPLVREVREHCGLRQDSEALLKNFSAITGDDSPISSSGQSQEGSTD